VASDNLFELGYVLVSPAAESLLRHAGQNLDSLLDRHRSGDWGVLPDDADRLHNEHAVREGGYLLSCYPVGGGEVWVETDPEREFTRVMRPWEC
jgi:hypothetical protein